jgi:hypothetical protein
VAKRGDGEWDYRPAVRVVPEADCVGKEEPRRVHRLQTGVTLYGGDAEGRLIGPRVAGAETTTPGWFALEPTEDRPVALFRGPSTWNWSAPSP